jgi:Ca-activated chloride channel family protein
MKGEFATFLSSPIQARPVVAEVEAARRRHAAALRSYAAELLRGDRGGVEKVLGETWSACAKLSEPDKEGQLATWLFADVRRRAHARQRGTALAEQFEGHDAPAEADESPEALFERLTPKQQEVLQLKFAHGFRHEEIARIVDLSPAHAAQLLHNALRRLARGFASPPSPEPAAAASDDHRLTLAAVGELDGEAWRAWEAGQTNPEHTNARLEEIRRAAKWIAGHLARGGHHRRRARARRKRGFAGWIAAGMIALGLAGAFWAWPPTAEGDARDGPKAMERPRASAPAVAVRREVSHQPTNAHAAGADAKTLGVYRSPVPTGTRKTEPVNPAASESGASGSPAVERDAGRPSREPDAIKEGIESAERVAEPAARATGRESSEPVLAESAASPADEKAVAIGGPPAPIASTDTAAIVALKRALGASRWPSPAQVDASRLPRYFAAASLRRVGGRGFAKTFEAVESPWTPGEVLLRVSAQAPDAPPLTRAPANVILLLDVSGSMAAPDRLPLVQEAVCTLLDRLQPQDRVGVVTYAGESTVLLPPTGLDEPGRVRAAVQGLEARGRTNGGAGLQEAFALAAGDTRAGEQLVILCTDGEFNMGELRADELARLVGAQAERGVRLAIFGFGRHGDIDPRLEQLAALGRGGSGYVNTRADAVAVMLAELDRLIGPAAERVRLAVAVEEAPHGSVEAESLLPGESLATLVRVPRPQAARARLSYRAGPAGEGFRETFGWDGEVRPWSAASPELRFAAAVERFTELLRGPPARAAEGLNQLLAWTEEGVEDAGGYRAEFRALVEQARAAAAAAR